MSDYRHAPYLVKKEKEALLREREILEAQIQVEKLRQDLHLLRYAQKIGQDSEASSTKPAPLRADESATMHKAGHGPGAPASAHVASQMEETSLRQRGFVLGLSIDVAYELVATHHWEWLGELKREHLAFHHSSAQLDRASAMSDRAKRSEEMGIAESLFRAELRDLWIRCSRDKAIPMLPFRPPESRKDLYEAAAEKRLFLRGLDLSDVEFFDDCLREYLDQHWDILERPRESFTNDHHGFNYSAIHVQDIVNHYLREWEDREELFALAEARQEGSLRTANAFRDFLPQRLLSMLKSVPVLNSLSRRAAARKARWRAPRRAKLLAQDLHESRFQEWIQQVVSHWSRIMTFACAVFMIVMFALGAWHLAKATPLFGHGAGTGTAAAVGENAQKGHDHTAITESLMGLELMLVAVLPYLLMMGLSRYSRALAFRERVDEFRRELLDFKAFEVALLIAIIAAIAIAKIIEGTSLKWEVIVATVAMMAALITYFFVIEKRGAEEDRHELEIRRLRLEEERNTQHLSAASNKASEPDQDRTPHH